MHAAVRPLTGAITVLVIVGIVFGAIGLFRGGFTESVPLTVLSSRAGLVMDPDAKVKLHGAQIGKVASIQLLPDGQAALHLAIDPAELSLIPSNASVDIASTTVFGAKSVEFVTPANPSKVSVQAGQVLRADTVTVEVNTIFQQLVALLGSIDPSKLNQTLTAISMALNGRGPELGQAFGDIDSALAKLDPALPALEHDLQVLPKVAGVYADSASDLMTIFDRTSTFSRTIVEEHDNLDALLVSSIGLADIGNDVLQANGAPLTDVLRLLVPTTELLDEYSPGLSCGLRGIIRQAKTPPGPVPGGYSSATFGFGIERYRYPRNLPKVAATGGPQCVNLPIPFGATAPFVVTDDGANPWQYGNQQLLLNADGLKQALFGPLDGPPRNTPQIGQPG
jgi:phospholipid/cholesterol/gamma-HCH transport system substrate-binding protein